MTTRQAEEAKGFKLIGHDRSAAWGGGSIVEIRKGYAYVGAVGGARNSNTFFGLRGSRTSCAVKPSGPL